MTDLYFWLVRGATGDPPSTVVHEHTLTLAAVGFPILDAPLPIRVVLCASRSTQFSYRRRYAETFADSSQPVSSWRTISSIS